MGIDNPLHIAFLILLLLLIFGAKRLPEMGRSLGSGLRGFRESISGEASATPSLTPPASTPTPTDIQGAGHDLAASRESPVVSPHPTLGGRSTS